jgi:predicted helicase
MAYQSRHEAMHRAVAFSRSIKDSKRLTDLFAKVVDEYCIKHLEDENTLVCEIDHVDGTFNALLRNERLDWLPGDLL